MAASIAASITHPLDLTKVRLQTSGDKGMIKSIQKTIASNGTSNMGSLSLTWLNKGVRGLFDGLTGTLLRQMTYSMMRFAVYDEAKKAVHTGEFDLITSSGHSLVLPWCRPSVQDGFGRKYSRRRGWRTW